MFREDFKRELSELGIDVAKGSNDALRDAVVAQLAALHPDKTGGTFSDKDQENRFLRIKELLERMDSATSMASQLIPINQVVTLVDVLSKLQSTSARASELKQVEVSDRYKDYLKRKYALPKITSAVVAGLCFALFSLLGSFRQNPLYRSAVEFYAQDSKGAVALWVNSTTEDLARRMYVLSMQHGFVNDEISELKEISNPRRPGGRIEYYSESRLRNRFRRLQERLSADDVSASREIHEMYYDPVYIALFESTEPDFLQRIKKGSAQLGKDLATDVTTLTSITPASDARKRDKDELVAVMAAIGSSLTVLDGDAKSAEEQLTRRKNAAIRAGDVRILWRLAILTALACLVFALLWIRERSDERWVDFLATDEGAEAVLARLSTNSNFMDREPPGFSLTEFTKVVGEKDVPRLLAPIAGAKLDIKRLGKISGFLLEKLKNKKVISERTTPSFQTWFEVHVQNAKASEETGTTAKS